jgi:uncharacterized protein with HEPN domain
MLDVISEIEVYTKGVDKDTFVNHSMMFNATLRQLEIIGEAANHISEDVQTANPEILWARIIALRNLVIHEYFGIDDNSIWSILQINLPEFPLSSIAHLHCHICPLPQENLHDLQCLPVQRLWFQILCVGVPESLALVCHGTF